MKMVAFILDGRGVVNITATRAPDLLRRQFKSETGSAELLYCQMPIPGIATDTLCIRLQNRLRIALGENALTIPATPIVLKTVRKAVFRVTVLEPKMTAAKVKVKHLLLRVAFSIGLKQSAFKP